MTTPDYRSVLTRLRTVYAEQHADSFDWEVDTLASPIEKVFLAALLTSGWRERFWCATEDVVLAERELESVGLRFDASRTPATSQRLLMQYGYPSTIAASQMQLPLQGRTIRPDFIIVSCRVDHIPGDYTSKVVVELDGHAFHERTPEQAQSDKSRDRELQAAGWFVLRFTGREVLRQPEKCVDEAVALAGAKRLLAYQNLKGD